MERIFAHKSDPAKQEQRLLVKWRGLPYAESTFESLQDVLKIGGQQDIIEYQVPRVCRPFDSIWWPIVPELAATVVQCGNVAPRHARFPARQRGALFSE